MHDICELCRTANINVRAYVPESREDLLRAEIQREQAKVRRFKDDLVVQLYLREKGPFWDAIREVRERRHITARKELPPSGPGISGLILPSSEGQFFDVLDWWLEELRYIVKRCIPARFHDSAEWREFVSACVLCDPPDDKLLEFANHGDPYYYDPARPGGRGDRAPLRAKAPLGKLLADESELENLHFWLFERLLNELEHRVEPVGIDLKTMVGAIFETTNLRQEYQSRKKELQRHWHIRVESGVLEQDVREAYQRIPKSEKGASIGGAPKRNRLVALQCAILYDHHNPLDAKGQKRWTYARLAESLSIPKDEVSEYIKDGERMLPQAERE